MFDFLSHRIFRKILEIGFMVWGIIILSLYFYYYPSYGRFFILGLEIILYCCLILIVLGVLIFISFPVLELLNLTPGREKSIKMFRYKIATLEIINVPLLFFLSFFYGSSIIWIGYIFYRSKSLEIVGNDILTVFLISVLAVIAFSLGFKILKFFCYDFSCWLERYILSSAIGFGVLMVAMYFLGMFGLYYRSVAYILVGSIILVTQKEIREFLVYIKNKKIIWNAKPIFSFGNFLVLSILAISFFYVAGIFQQYPLGFDALHSYAAFPKAFIDNHRIVDAPYWFYSGFPKNAEMLFTLAMLLGSFSSMTGIIWLFIFILGGLIYFVSYNLFNKESAKLALFFYLSLPMTSGFSIEDNKIDLIFVFYSLLTLYYLYQYINFPRKNSIYIFAIFMGITAGIKYNFFLMLFPSLWLVIFLSQRLIWKEKIKVILVSGFFVAFLFSPWAVKNYIYSGNPIEPLMGDYFSREDTFLKRVDESYSENIEAIIDNDKNLIYERQEVRDWKFYILLPFKLVLNIKSENPLGLLNMGFAIIAFAPLLIFDKINLFFKKEIIIFALLYTVFWSVFTCYIMWYLLTAIIIFYIYIAYAISKTPFKSIKTASVVLSFCFLISFLVRQSYIYYKIPSLYERQMDSSAYGSFMGKYINKELNDGIIWSSNYPLNYYIDDFPSKIVFDYYLFNFYFLTKDKSDEEVKSILNSIGVKYFLYAGSKDSPNDSFILNKALYNSSVDPQTAKKMLDVHLNFFKFRDKHLKLIKKEGNFYLYKLK